MIFCFVLSFGGKEQAVTLPVCLLWIDLACRRSFREWKLWSEKIPVFVLSLLFSLITIDSNATANVGILGDQAAYPFIYRIVFACYAFCEYMMKSLFPVNFTVDERTILCFIVIIPNIFLNLQYAGLLNIVYPGSSVAILFAFRRILNENQVLYIDYEQSPRPV